jgi:transposase-like protein
LPKKGNLLHYAARLSEQRKEVARRLHAGETVSGLARQFDVDQAIIIRARKAA